MSKISVIIPLYKGNKYVKYWLEKIKNNVIKLHLLEMVECEVVFVNDFPKEKIEVEVTAYGFDIKILNSDVNRGVHGARVYGLMHSSGEYVVFLDQDDSISDTYLVSQYQKIGEKDGVVCNAYSEKKWSSFKYKRYIDTNEHQRVNDYNTFVEKFNFIFSPGQVMLKKESIPEEWKLYIMKNNGVDDLFLWLLMLRQGKEFAINESYCYSHIENEDSISSNRIQMGKSRDELVDILEKAKLIPREDICTLQQHDVAWDENHRSAAQRARISDKWFYLKSRGVKIEEYFWSHNYQKIMIYGMSKLADYLLLELENSSIQVICGIDKMEKRLHANLPIVTNQDRRIKEWMEEVDVVVVTAVKSYDEIKDNLLKKYNVQVVFIEEILNYFLKKEI